MSKPKRERNNIVAITGAAVLTAAAAAAVNFAITAIKAQKNKHKKKDLPRPNVRTNLSAPEIVKLADQVIAKSNEVHDSVASVPIDKVTYKNVILPLAELEGHQFPLVQSCVIPKLVSVSEDARKASAEAEQKIAAHVSMCSKREDVYSVVTVFAARGEWMSPEAKKYTECLVRDFENNGLNLTATKREELQHLKAQIDELSMRYIQNLSDDSTSVLFNYMELDGLPPEFLEILDQAENGKFKVTLKSHHVSPVLELCKVGLTRRVVAVAYARRCEVNLSVLERLVYLRHKFARLLGYSNYADFAIGPRMAKSSSK